MPLQCLIGLETDRIHLAWDWDLRHAHRHAGKSLRLPGVKDPGKGKLTDVWHSSAPKQQPNNVFLVNKKKDLNAGPSGWSRPDGDAAGAAVARSNDSEHLTKFWNINFPLTFYKKNTTSPSVAAASAAMRLGTARTPTINFQNIHTKKKQT